MKTDWKTVVIDMLHDALRDAEGWGTPLMYEECLSEAEYRDALRAGIQALENANADHHH